MTGLVRLFGYLAFGLLTLSALAALAGVGLDIAPPFGDALARFATPGALAGMAAFSIWILLRMMRAALGGGHLDNDSGTDEGYGLWAGDEIDDR